MATAARDLVTGHQERITGWIRGQAWVTQAGIVFQLEVDAVLPLLVTSLSLI